MDPSLIFTVDIERLSRLAPELPREAVRVAALFDGKRRLWEVLRDSYLPSRMTVSIFGRLRDLELVATQEERAEVVYEAEPRPAATPEQKELAATLRLPSMRVVPPATEPAEEPEVLPAAPEADAAEPVHTPEEPVLEATPEPRPAPVSVAAPPQAAAALDFDETDHAFFDSYEPEDSTVDTFWDLEDTPAKQRAARLRQKRLNRRRGGWLAQLLLT